MPLIPELERELQRAIERAGALTTAPTPRRRRLRVALVPALCALACATAALAATGVIPIGPPVSDSHVPKPRPDQGNGVVLPGTVKLLKLQTPDPIGGPPWGLRITATSRGLGCLQTGRLVDGRLGVLGTAKAYKNDGRLHPLPSDSMLSPGGCGQLDAHRRLFFSVVASGARASASVTQGCEPAQFTRGVPADQLCDDERDLRNLYFGTLGPEAESVTYTAPDGPHTVPVVGPQGAYLIVLPITASRTFNGTGGGLFPYNSPITELAFRSGLRCRIGEAGPVPDEKACPIPGYQPVTPPKLTPRAVRRKVTARAVRTGPGRYTIEVRFHAPVAIRDASNAYNITLHPPRPGPNRQYAVGVTSRDIAKGELVVQKFTYQRRHGRYHGDVTFVSSTRPGIVPILPSKLVVGRFSVRLP